MIGPVAAIRGVKWTIMDWLIKFCIYQRVIMYQLMIRINRISLVYQERGENLMQAMLMIINQNNKNHKVKFNKKVKVYTILGMEKIDKNMHRFVLRVHPMQLISWVLVNNIKIVTKEKRSWT